MAISLVSWQQHNTTCAVTNCAQLSPTYQTQPAIAGSVLLTQFGVLSQLLTETTPVDTRIAQVRQGVTLHTGRDR